MAAKGFLRGSGKVEVWQQKGSGVAVVGLRCGSRRGSGRVEVWQRRGSRQVFLTLYA